MSITLEFPAAAPRTVVRKRAVDADRHVGAKMRERRIMLGLTQAVIADRLGITLQQLSKYERGLNRLSAGRLWALARALGVEVGWFFKGLAGDGETPQQDFSQEEVSAWVRSQR
jgi:transcriptional regulator with XRE-family HTH domain